MFPFDPRIYDSREFISSYSGAHCFPSESLQRQAGVGLMMGLKFFAGPIPDGNLQICCYIPNWLLQDND